MEKKKKFIAIILAIIALAAIAAAEPAEVKIESAYKLVEKGQNFTVNISIDPNGTAIAGAQLNLEFNNSRINIIVNETPVNVVLEDGTVVTINNRSASTEGDLFAKNGLRSFFNPGTVGSGIMENVFSAILGNFSTQEKGDLINITLFAVTNETSELNISNLKIANRNSEPTSSNLTVITICASPRYDINCVDHRVNIVDLTILNQNIGKTGEAICPQYEHRCDIDNNGAVNIIDKTKLQQEYNKIIPP